MVNKWFGLGRLTADPEVRYTQGENGQMAIARYTLAIDRLEKDKGTDFISCVAFGKNGEFAEKYLRKGMKTVITGRIQTGSYTKQDGTKVYTTDIVVETQDFADSKKDSEEKPTPAPDSNGFMNIPDDIDEQLPFN